MHLNIDIWTNSPPEKCPTLFILGLRESIRRKNVLGAACYLRLHPLSVCSAGLQACLSGFYPCKTQHVLLLVYLLFPSSFLSLLLPHPFFLPIRSHLVPSEILRDTCVFKSGWFYFHQHQRKAQSLCSPRSWIWLRDQTFEQMASCLVAFCAYSLSRSLVDALEVSRFSSGVSSVPAMSPMRLWHCSTSAVALDFLFFFVGAVAFSEALLFVTRGAVFLTFLIVLRT